MSWRRVASTLKDAINRRFPSAEPALSLPKGYGMLRVRGRGHGGSSSLVARIVDDLASTSQWFLAAGNLSSGIRLQPPLSWEGVMGFQGGEGEGM